MDSGELRFMPARSFFGQAYTSLWSQSEASPSPVRLSPAYQQLTEKRILAGNRRLRSNNQDRRFESILLHHSVTPFSDSNSLRLDASGSTRKGSNKAGRDEAQSAHRKVKEEGHANICIAEHANS
jgi:hypothetical protein